jgi:hypothetical protein
VLVRGRGVDREPVVPAFLEQVPRDEPDRLRAETSALSGRRQEEVDVRVAVVRRRLLVEGDRADQLAVGLDRQSDVVLGLDEVLADVVGVVVAPPPCNLGLVQDLEEPVGVLGTDGAKRDPVAFQGRRW